MQKKQIYPFLIIIGSFIFLENFFIAKVFSQSCVWPGEQRTYYVDPEVCHPAVIAPISIVGGSVQQNGSNSFTVTWDNSPTGTLVYERDCNSNYNQYTVEVIKILDIVTDIEIEPTLQANIEYSVRALTEGNPTIVSWSIHESSAPYTLIKDLSITNPNFLFTSSDHTELQGYPSTGDNLAMQVTYTNGCITDNVQELFSIQLSAPEASAYEVIKPTCSGSADAKLIINSITIDGKTYSETEQLIEPVQISIFTDDIVQLGIAVETVQSLPDTIEANLQNATFPSYDYEYTIERYFGDEPSGITDTTIFTVGGGPSLYLDIDETSESCFRDNITINAQVRENDENGNVVNGSFDFYTTSGTLAGSSNNGDFLYPEITTPIT